MLQNSFSRVSSSFGRTVSRTMAGAVKSSLFDAKDAASDTVDVGTSFKPTSVLFSTDNVHSFNKPSFSVDGGAVKLDSPTLFDMSEGSIDFETEMSIFRVGGFDFGSFVSSYFAHRDKMGSTREVLKRMKINGEDVTLEVVRPEDAQDCVDCQEALPEESKKTVLMRSLEEYRSAASGENHLVCVRDSKGKVVATSAAVETVHGEHVKFYDGSKFLDFVDDGKTKFMELSVSMVDPKYRGHNLQSVMYEELCKRVEKLHANGDRLFTAACVLGNLPSCKNIMNAGLEACGLHKVNVNGEEKDIVVFARHPDKSSIKSKEELVDGERALKDGNFLRSILKQGKSVSSEVQSGTRKYFIVSR